MHLHIDELEMTIENFEWRHCDLSLMVTVEYEVELVRDRMPHPKHIQHLLVEVDLASMISNADGIALPLWAPDEEQEKDIKQALIARLKKKTSYEYGVITSAVLDHAALATR